MKLPWPVDSLIYLARFESKKHIREYATLIESLIQQAKQRVMANETEELEAVRSGTCPTVDTSNRIRMMYSIVQSAEGFFHHFSMSRRPHLPSRHAKHLAALFCNLAEFSLPDELGVSEHGVYHLGIILNPQEQEMFAEGINLDRGSPEEEFRKALTDSIPMTIKKIGQPAQ